MQAPAIPRHCERSEAIQEDWAEAFDPVPLDCFVASLLAMTAESERTGPTGRLPSTVDNPRLDPLHERDEHRISRWRESWAEGRMAEGIAWVEPPGLAGAIGMLPLPGLVIAKRGERFVDGALQDEVLDTLAAWQTVLLVILLDDDEYDPDELDDLASAAEARSITLLRTPIADFSAPDQRLDWPPLIERLAGELRQGRRIAFCCLAGYGRSGMMAARLLIATGSTPQAAITAVRAARPGAIESEEQIAYLLSCTP